MTITAIPGSTTERFIQLGIQSVLNTPVTPTRKVGWRGIPVYNPGVTDPDVDVGSLDPILLPYTLAAEVGADLTGPLDFDNAAVRLSAGLMGGSGSIPLSRFGFLRTASSTMRKRWKASALAHASLVLAGRYRCRSAPSRASIEGG